MAKSALADEAVKTALRTPEHGPRADQDRLGGRGTIVGRSLTRIHTSVGFRGGFWSGRAERELDFKDYKRAAVAYANAEETGERLVEVWIGLARIAAVQGHYESRVKSKHPAPLKTSRALCGVAQLLLQCALVARESEMYYRTSSSLDAERECQAQQQTESLYIHRNTSR